MLVNANKNVAIFKQIHRTGLQHVHCCSNHANYL